MPCWPSDNSFSVEWTVECSAYRIMSRYGLNNSAIPSENSARSEAKRGSVDGGSVPFQVNCEVRFFLHTSSIAICLFASSSSAHRSFSSISLVVGKCGRAKSRRALSRIRRDTLVQ